MQVTCANKVEYSQRCDSNPCKNGQCLGGIDDFYCLCDVNWKGKTCDEKSKYRTRAISGRSRLVATPLEIMLKDNFYEFFM